MPLFVTVTPGTTVTSSTTLDASTLNLLGTPSVDVTGSVDGGSLTLGSNSVNSNAIQNDAVIESKILNGSITDAKLATNSVIAEKISAGAVTTAKLANSTSTSTGVTFAKIQQIAAGKLVGNSSESTGSLETVSIGTGLTLSAVSGLKANSLLKKNIGGTTADVDTITYFKSNDLDIPIDVGSAHAASAVIGSNLLSYDCYFKCITAEGDYSAGDFIKYSDVYANNSGPSFQGQMYYTRATGGSVKIIKTSWSNPRIYNATNGTWATFTPTNWKAIIIATTLT
jgi:hypothetical protein